MTRSNTCAGCGDPILGNESICTNCKWGGTRPGQFFRIANWQEALITPVVILLVAGGLVFGCKIFSLLAGAN